jgi:hypothetical protein
VYSLIYPAREGRGVGCECDTWVGEERRLCNVCRTKLAYTNESVSLLGGIQSLLTLIEVRGIKDAANSKAGIESSRSRVTAVITGSTRFTFNSKSSVLANTASPTFHLSSAQNL